MDYEKFITTIGALAESVAMFYSGLVQNGIEHDDALEIVKAFITTTLKP